MASTRITVTTSAAVGPLLLSTVNQGAEFRSRVARLKAFADSAAAGADWASMATAFGLADATTAETVYNLITSADAALNAGDLDALIDRIATS